MSRPSAVAVFTLLGALAAVVLYERLVHSHRQAEAVELRSTLAANVDLVHQARDDLYDGYTKAGRQKLQSALLHICEAYALLPEDLSPLLYAWHFAVLKYRNAALANALLQEMEVELDRLEAELMKLAG